MPNGHAWSTSRRALRYRLTLLLRRADRPMSIAELAAGLAAMGRPAPDPTPKTISDSLRWEVGHGRVVRVGRGRYGPGQVDRRTAWWMQRQLDVWHRVERLSESDPPRGPAAPDPAPAWLTALRPPPR
jgi:hypothetical protein